MLGTIFGGLGPLMGILMFGYWALMAIFLSTIVFMIYFHLTGKEEEYLKAKKLLMKVLTVIGILIIFSIVFYFIVNFNAPTGHT